MPIVNEKDSFYTIEMQEQDSNTTDSSDQTKQNDYQNTTLRFPPVKLTDDSNWSYFDGNHHQEQPKINNMDTTYNDDDDDDDEDTYNNSNNSIQDLNDEEGKTHTTHRGHDDDDEFDWNDDPDAPAKPKRRKTTRERIQAAMKKPCCWHFLSPFMKRLIIALFGSLIFIAIAVAIYLLLPEPTTQEENDPNFSNIRSNVQIWMYWAAFMWHIGWITTVFVEIIPSFVSLWTKIFVGRRSEKVKSSMEYYMAMKKYITILLLGSWNWGSWAFLLNFPFSSVKKQSYSWIIWKLFASIFVTTCLLFLQKLIIQIIATRFHRSAYSERIAENKHSLKVLDSLSKSEGRRSKTESNNNVRQRLTSQDSTQDIGYSNSRLSSEPMSYSTSYSAPQRSRGNTAEKLNNFHKRVQGMILTDRPQGLSRMETRKVDINSDDFAKKVAKKLFYSLAYPFSNGFPPPLATQDNGGTKVLEKHHFSPYFKTEEQCKAAFEVFDKDGNGDVTRREFRDTVVQIYRERKLLAQCIRDTSQALGKIDWILFILVMVINVFLCLTAIFNVDLYQALVPMGTFIMGLSFMFSNTVKVAFESIMFLFVTHPYDAGDNVLIDDVTLTVHNMGITGTVFIRGDGQKVYAPTTVLMTKLITNVRRSGDMGESITLNVDFRTSTDLVFKLRERMAAWVEDQPREFSSGFDIRLQEIVDVNKLVLTIWLPHKGNWQNVGKRLQRRNRFMFMLKDTLDDLKIHYELPAQRITTSSPYTDNPFANESTQSFATGAHAAIDPSAARPHNVRMYGYTQSTAADADGS
ncbi:uncharacterized protein BX664DRAFT_333906 [Halteromyces radiatus]|uniref:uncharacterized protein n=1 Tax=Halteromyces radiatus TaxID=101107 RepID=UPI00221FF801|nr:uncharacterized protein BX664DRAFT_333906 [Halteromyces radiatus]KAI8089795.1 hypothetical protein BX664DRAFT_333906 [Halteromyces radiatus]